MLISSDLIIKIYTKYPQVKKGEDPELAEDEENQEVEIITKLLGFAIVDVSGFMKAQELDTIEKKYNVFEYENEQLFQNHELFWPLDNEMNIIAASSDLVNKIRLDKYTPEVVIFVTYFKGGR